MHQSAVTIETTIAIFGREVVVFPEGKGITMREGERVYLNMTARK